MTFGMPKVTLIVRTRVNAILAAMTCFILSHLEDDWKVLEGGAVSDAPDATTLRSRDNPDHFSHFGSHLMKGKSFGSWGVAVFNWDLSM